MSFAEPYDLSRFRVPMQPIPARVERAIARGVEPAGADLTFPTVAKLLEEDGDGRVDGAFRNPDGTMTVCVLTDMPGVAPEMWDWWFGWHGISSERYRLWHPIDHKWSAMASDTTALPDVRSRYVGNVSYVGEVVGTMMQLTIAFRPPDEFGLPQARVDEAGTAICAVTGMRRQPLETGRLVHLVRRTPRGSEMLSRFYLGHARLKIPVLGPLLGIALNTPFARRSVLHDATGLALLRHCSAEMNHLARLLPELFAAFADPAARSATASGAREA